MELSFHTMGLSPAEVEESFLWRCNSLIQTNTVTGNPLQKGKQKSLKGCPAKSYVEEQVKKIVKTKVHKAFTLFTPPYPAFHLWKTNSITCCWCFPSTSVDLEEPQEIGFVLQMHLECRRDGIGATATSPKGVCLLQPHSTCCGRSLDYVPSVHPHQDTLPILSHLLPCITEDKFSIGWKPQKKKSNLKYSCLCCTILRYIPFWKVHSSFIVLVEYICLLAVIFLILNFSQSWSSQPVHELLVTESLLEIVTVSNRSFTFDHAVYCCTSHHFIQVTFIPPVVLEAFRVRSWILKYIFPDLWNLLLRSDEW